MHVTNRTGFFGATRREVRGIEIEYERALFPQVDALPGNHRRTLSELVKIVAPRALFEGFYTRTNMEQQVSEK